jgi:hypothetical protein
MPEFSVPSIIRASDGLVAIQAWDRSNNNNKSFNPIMVRPLGTSNGRQSFEIIAPMSLSMSTALPWIGYREYRESHRDQSIVDIASKLDTNTVERITCDATSEITELLRSGSDQPHWLTNCCWSIE